MNLCKVQKLCKYRWVSSAVCSRTLRKTRWVHSKSVSNLVRWKGGLIPTLAAFPPQCPVAPTCWSSPQSTPVALWAKTTGAGKMQPTGWKMLVDSILVCLRLVSEQWGRFLDHLSCRWDSWTPTPDTDRGGKRPCGTTRSLEHKWDSARLKLTVISQTVCERQRKALREATAQIFTRNTECFDSIWHISLLLGAKLQVETCFIKATIAVYSKMQTLKIES